MFFLALQFHYRFTLVKKKEETPRLFICKFWNKQREYTDPKSYSPIFRTSENFFWGGGCIFIYSLFCLSCTPSGHFKICKWKGYEIFFWVVFCESQQKHLFISEEEVTMRLSFSLFFWFISLHWLKISPITYFMTFGQQRKPVICINMDHL